jgi:hypothetical protein
MHKFPENKPDPAKGDSHDQLHIRRHRHRKIQMDFGIGQFHNLQRMCRYRLHTPNARMDKGVAVGSMCSDYMIRPSCLMSYRK